MAVHTQLAPEELDAVLARWNVGAVRAVTGLAAGSINTSYVVDAAAGRFLARLFEGKDAGEVAYEVALVERLAAAGVAVVAPLRSRDGAAWIPLRGRCLSLFPWIEGEELPVEGPELAGPLRARALGGALAALHRAAEGFALHRAGAYSLEQMAGRLPALRAAAPGDAAVAAALPDLESEHAFLAAALPACALPEGTIHGDLFPDNVKWRGTEVAALLDFDMAQDGPWMRDLATTLVSWCFDAAGAFVWADMAAMAAGYAAVRPLAPAERAPGLWLWSRFVAWRYTVSRLTDFHLSPLPPERLVRKDFRRYLARLRALRAIDAEELARRLAL